MATLEQVLAAEDGDIDGLQALIDGGTWSLQGSTGRAMMAAIEQGRAILGPRPARDYFGNFIPAWWQVEAGTKGSPEYRAAACDCGKGSACPLTRSNAADRLLRGLARAYGLDVSTFQYDAGLRVTVSGALHSAAAGRTLPYRISASADYGDAESAWALLLPTLIERIGTDADLRRAR